MGAAASSPQGPAAAASTSQGPATTARDQLDPAAASNDDMDGRSLLSAQHNPGIQEEGPRSRSERASVRPIGTFSATAIVVLQNIVGVGTLSFAKAFADASLVPPPPPPAPPPPTPTTASTPQVPGVVVLLASYGLGILSSVTIVACLEASQQQTFLGIVEHLFNRRAAVCVELAVGLTTFCSTLGTDLRLKPSTGNLSLGVLPTRPNRTAYMIDIVDALSHFIGAFNSNAFLTSRLFAALCVCVPCVVLTSFRDLTRLKPFSACGVLGLLFASLVVLFCCATNPSDYAPDEAPQLAAFAPDFFNSLSIGVLSFAMQYNVRATPATPTRPPATRRPMPFRPPHPPARCRVSSTSLASARATRARRPAACRPSPRSGRSSSGPSPSPTPSR